MPIVYETPAPIGAYADLANRGAFGGGGGGGGVQVINPYDTGIQQAITARDEFRQRGYETDSRNAVAYAGIEAQAAESQARGELQLQLQREAVTAPEKIRLSRMKAAIGEVMNDPNLSESEKNDLVMQLRTGINPIENRIAQERLHIDRMQKEQMIDATRLRAQLMQEELKVESTNFADRFKFVPDPQKLAEITQEILSRNPETTPDVAAKMASSVALRNGFGQTYYQETAKTWKPVEGHGASKSGGSGGEQDRMKAYQWAAENVDRRAGLRDQLGKPVHPELQTAEARAAAVRAEFEAALTFGGKPVTAPKYTDDLDQQMMRRVPVQAGGAGAGASGQASDLTAAADRINASGLTQDQKTAANFLLGRARKLIDSYPDPAKRPPEVARELNTMMVNFDKVWKAIPAEQPAAPTTVAAPAAQSPARPTQPPTRRNLSPRLQ